MMPGLAVGRLHASDANIIAHKRRMILVFIFTPYDISLLGKVLARMNTTLEKGNNAPYVT